MNRLENKWQHYMNRFENKWQHCMNRLENKWQTLMNRIETKNRKKKYECLPLVRGLKKNYQ